MFRPFIGSSSGPPEIQSKKLSLFYLHNGIPYVYDMGSHDASKTKIISWIIFLVGLKMTQ